MKLSTFAALSFLAASVSAQGSDSCASAQLIAGTGSFAFSNLGATTDGLPDGLCNFAGSSQIESDVWFEWVPPASGPYMVSTCGQTTIDSKIAVYNGSCAGAVLACNDDLCGLQSQLFFNALNTQTYIIRVGSYPGSAAGTGNIDIASAILASVTNPANGHTYHLLPGSSWSVAEAAAVSLGGHLATVRSQAEHDFLNASFHNYQGVDIDLWIGFNDATIEGTFAWASGETAGYTNWDLGEPNNAGAGEDYTVMRQNNPAAFWNDLPDAPTGFHANPHGVVEVLGSSGTPFCTADGLDPLVTTPCPCGNTGSAGRGCNNSQSTGGARLDVTGGTNPDTIVLAVTGELPTALSIFLQGNATVPSGIVFGDGVRCVGGGLKRLFVHNASGGAVSAPAPGDPSVSARSAALGDPIAPGSSRWYQVYSRDANTGFCPAPLGSTFNISNGQRLDW